MRVLLVDVTMVSVAMVQTVSRTPTHDTNNTSYSYINIILTGTVVFAIDAHSSPLSRPKEEEEQATNLKRKKKESHSKDDNIANSKLDHRLQHPLLRQHLANLFTPSSPAYFNTYYDAYVLILIF